MKGTGSGERLPMVIDVISLQVAAEARRVARLGDWPEWIDPQSLVQRVPRPGRISSGFDAGIACSLDLIPRDKQALSAQLHAAYTPQAVKQIQRELDDLHPDHETCWWLAACSICEEGGIDEAAFVQQLDTFRDLYDPDRRLQAALGEWAQMQQRFWIQDGYPFGTEDGCMQAAYIAGHPFASSYAEDADLFFIGTYYPSLGLEDFSWSSETDIVNGQSLPRSGPVHGSRQFVKAHNQAEFEAALTIVQAHFQH